MTGNLNKVNEAVIKASAETSAATKDHGHRTSSDKTLTAVIKARATSSPVVIGRTMDNATIRTATTARTTDNAPIRTVAIVRTTDHVTISNAMTARTMEDNATTAISLVTTAPVKTNPASKNANRSTISRRS